MTTQRQLLTALIAVLAAALISFVLTPVVKALAPKFGFVDVPKDERRMHNHPIPTIGGLAIFVSFVLVSLFVCHLNRQFIGMLLGALVIVVLGVVDDKYDLMRHPNIRLAEDGGAPPYDYTQAKDAADDLDYSPEQYNDFELLDPEDFLDEKPRKKLPY